MSGTLTVVNEIIRRSNSDDLKYRFTMLRNHYYNKALHYDEQIADYQKLLSTRVNAEDIAFDIQRITWLRGIQNTLMSTVIEVDILLGNEQPEHYYLYTP
jgi:hypothetical protein